MTENEAIIEIKRWTNILMNAGSQCTLDTAEAQEMAIKALEEIQQYRAIGTVKECHEAREKQKSTGWIPCIERLPEESLNSVLGWNEYRQRCCFVQYYGGRWILGNGIESVKITAWQPIPEPYKS